MWLPGQIDREIQLQPAIFEDLCELEEYYVVQTVLRKVQIKYVVRCKINSPVQVKMPTENTSLKNFRGT